MTKLLLLIVPIIFTPTYLLSEIVTIYANQSAQYSANDCCTLNTITNQNGNSLYSQDCQDMGTYYGCGMSKQVPFWGFDLSILDSSIDIQSIQFKGTLPTEGWSDVYLSTSTTNGQISTTIASDLWNGGNWTSGSGQYSSIDWPMGDFNQSLPLEIISPGIISGQLNILTYTSNPWTSFPIVNTGDNAPRLVIDYDNIDVNCTADDGTEGIELWEECYSIDNTTYIDLSNSALNGDLAGEIPPAIGSLTTLYHLALGGNQLTGEIPSEIYGMTALTFLSLGANQLTGEIPSEIGNLINLTYLDLGGNQLTGEIPTEIGDLTSLGFLFLNDNQLTGEIPSEIGNIPDLGTFFLMDNQLSGIPDEFCDWNSNFSFYLFNNHFCPPYPECVQDNIGAQDTTNCNSLIQTVYNPITGRTWMDRNLGAIQVATSTTDTASFGSLYQWGRSSDGHEERTSSAINTTSSSDTAGHSYFILADSDWRFPPNDSLWQGLFGINNPCPEGFRLPTENEFEEERLTWSSNDADGAFNSPLKLSLAGARSRMNGAIGNIGTFSGYRTSTRNGTLSRVLGIAQSISQMGNRDRADGNCVRCIKDEQTQVSIINEELIPELFTIHQNYPNPFNPVTNLSYDLLEDSFVLINIYDLRGNVVNKLVNKNQNSGSKSVQWDATNDQGESVSAGVYLYKIQAGDFSQTKKMVLLK